MPTYNNQSSDIIYIRGITIKPNQTGIETPYMLDMDSRLKRVSDEPFYNPLVDIHQVEFASAEEQVIDIDQQTTRIVQIYKIKNCKVTVYINAKTNLPALPMEEGDKFSVRALNSVDKLILVSDQQGSCVVVEKVIGDVS